MSAQTTTFAGKNLIVKSVILLRLRMNDEIRAPELSTTAQDLCLTPPGAVVWGSFAEYLLCKLLGPI